MDVNVRVNRHTSSTMSKAQVSLMLTSVAGGVHAKCGKKALSHDDSTQQEGFCDTILVTDVLVNPGEAVS